MGDMAQKDERLAVRVTTKQMTLIREAAELEGRNLSDFATAALTQHATDVIADQRIFRLTGAQWNELVAILDRPPVYRHNLAEALRQHAKRVGHSE
jgi:uncharacterized protein (DUF1778 family)